MRALDRGLDIKDGRLYRNSRILAASLFGQGGSIVGAALGGAIGHALSGTTGITVGGSVGAYLGSTAVSLADPWIPEYFHKPDPRQFTEHILRPLSKAGSRA